MKTKKYQDKRITLENDVKVMLSILAAKAGTNCKNYIENILSNHVKEKTACTK